MPVYENTIWSQTGSSDRSAICGRDQCECVLLILHNLSTDPASDDRATQRHWTFRHISVCSPILDEQGTIVYALVAFQDIMERKRADNILADYSRELEQEVSDRTAELAQTNVQLQQEITEREQAQLALQFVNQELQHLASVDGLTQIANRRCFDQRLQHEWFRLAREQQPLSLILFDVDYFKRYNDRIFTTQQQ